jgi:segregation and condensation protein A
LDRFDGPLDLLLHLIKEDELDITDIPIARITDQYLESIREVDQLDLDRAGEYLLMAATLMRIKAKMLIPREDDEEDDEDAIDPRAELVRRLLEYREFKRVAEGLRIREDEWRLVFRRASAPLPEMETEDFDDLGVSMVELFRAFGRVLDRVDRTGPLEMQMEEYAVAEQMEFLRDELKRGKGGVPFTRLFEQRRTRAFVITTFLALLEMIREREIVAVQADRFGEIWLRNDKEALEPHDS